MKTGDAVTDAQGRSWTLGEMLGRGLWGTSWAVRDAQGRELVLKIALSEADLPADAPVPDGMLAACRQAALEQADLLKRQAFPWLPRLEQQLEVQGVPALLFPRYPSSLKRRMAGGVGVADTIALLMRVVKLLEESGSKPHGDLRPSNVLINDRGEPVLSDVLTPALVPWRARLGELASDREDWHPPEADSQPPRPVWDTWALCLMLWRAASAQPAVARDGRREEPRVQLPRQGLDKVEIASLRDRVLARLKDERANLRFAPRLSERLGTLLNRGLSRETEPSPPYRFLDPAALRPRLEEVAELVDPRVTDVGHLLLGSNAKSAVFQGGETAAFSVTIGVSSGVSGHEDVAIGVAVHDLDAPDQGRVPVPDTRYSVKAHPSGRLRFDFSLPGLPPGRYRVNVAFTIKDGHHDPLVAQGEFEVRPPPGYVPPPEEPAGPVPLQLPRRNTEAPADEQAAEPQPKPLAARGDPDADVFPLPLAPSSPGFADGPSDPGDAPAPVEVEVEIEATVGPSTSPPFAGRAGSEPGVAPPMLVMPRIAPPPSASPTIAPASQPDEPLTRPSDAPPPGWNPPIAPAPRPLASPVDYDDVAADPNSHGGFVPGPSGGEDLPSWGGAERSTSGGTGFPVGAWIERGIEYVRRDTYTAFMLILGGMLGMLIVVFALLKSC
jgi:hypothetical protein